MAFREKLLWTQLVALLGFGGAYFLPVFGSYLGWGAPPVGQFVWLVLCILGLIAGQIVVTGGMAVIAALHTPREARTAKDERDRQIDLLGTRTGFYVLVVGAMAAMVTVHLGAGAVLLVNFVFFALLLAELSRLGTQVFIYRRGW